MLNMLCCVRTVNRANTFRRTYHTSNYLTKEQRKEAKQLQKEDPLEQAGQSLTCVYCPCTGTHQTATQENFEAADRPRELTPKRAKLESWIQDQINKTPQHRAQRIEWRKEGNFELWDNIDMPWLEAIESKLAKLQEISLKEMNEARRARREGK